MKQEYINPFIRASLDVLQVTSQIEFATSKPYIKKSPFKPEEVLISVGITGQVRGHAVISMDESVAKLIASKMMMGMQVDSLDEMAKSALSELGNMVMGNVATLLYNQGVTVDITPPSLMVGENISISSNEMVTICIPLEKDDYRITLDVCLKEK